MAFTVASLGSSAGYSRYGHEKVASATRIGAWSRHRSHAPLPADLRRSPLHHRECSPGLLRLALQPPEQVTLRAAIHKAERRWSIIPVVLMTLVAEGGVFVLGLPVCANHSLGNVRLHSKCFVRE